MYLFDKDGKLVEIDIKDVISIESRDHSVMFRTGPDHFCPPMTLKQLSEVYNRLGFYQIDRSTLLNLHKAERVGKKYYVGHHAYIVSRRNELIVKTQFDRLR